MLLGVDVGGTFTDAVLVGDGRRRAHGEGARPRRHEQRGRAARRRGACWSGPARRPGDVERFAHGMTVATNALLEGRTARTALLATAGFTDVIELGRQNRPHLYRPLRAAPTPLVAAALRFAAPSASVPTGLLRALEPEPPRSREPRSAARPARGGGGRRSFTPTSTPRTSG